MIIGSLHIVKTWFWFLFPTKETAALVGHEPDPTMTSPATTRASLAWYSRRCNCEVTYFSPDSYIVFLEEDGFLKKVLTSDGKIGWTWFNESYNDCFEEVKAKS